MATKRDLPAVPKPITPGAEMTTLGRFLRDVTWTGTIVEGGMGPGTPAMTAIGRGQHTSIQDGRWIVGTYEQEQRLLDGAFVLTWQLHWVAGWDPAAGEYRATLADNYGHADVMRGQIDGDRLTFTTLGDPPGAPSSDLGPERSSRHDVAERGVDGRRGLVVDRGVPAHTRSRWELAMTVDRLTGQDLTHVVADEFGWPGHIGVIGILDGAGLVDDDGKLRVDDIRAGVARRLPLLPRFRQVIHSPRWGLGLPLWVDAPTVDLAYHIRLMPLPDRAGEEQLLHAVEALRRRPFDGARPRWELWLLPGLPHGRVGVFVKLHHAVADGVAGVALLGMLLSPESATDASQARRWLPARPPSTADLLRDNVRRQARRLRAAASGLAHPARTVARVREVWPAIREVLGEGRSPRTSLNRPIGRGRRMALVRHALADTKDVAHTAGATVNDVVLAAVAGGLREVLVARGEPVDDLVLRISVPVSLHRRPQAAHGNLDAPMAVPVPVREPDAALRLRMIAADSALRRARARPQVFTGLLGSRPAQRLVLRLMRRQRLVNAYVANVAGPTEPLRLAGARLLEMFALVPITANVTLGVGVISYAGQLNLTIVADQTSWLDLPVFLGGLEQAWSQLTDLAPQGAASNASRVTKP